MKKFPKNLKLFICKRLPIAIANDDVDYLKDRRHLSCTDYRISQAFDQSNADIFRHMHVNSVMSDIDFLEDFQAHFQMLLLVESMIDLLDQLLT